VINKAVGPGCYWELTIRAASVSTARPGRDSTSDIAASRRVADAALMSGALP
jgi:hypothetical protein